MRNEPRKSRMMRRSRHSRQARSSHRPRRRLRRAWLVAGAVLVAAGTIGAYFLVSSHGRTGAEQAAIAEKYLQPFPIPPLFGTMSPQAPYRAGIDAYRRGEFARAAETFGLLSGHPERWPGILFYRGLSQLFAGQTAAAAGSFRDHLRREPNATPARWYLALALLQSGSEEDARRELALIAAKSEGDYSSQARALLDELD